MEVEIRTPDVPYGDYFYLLERWVVGTSQVNAGKIFLKIFISVQIVKKTVFEKKIKIRAAEDYIALMKIWFENTKKKKLLNVPNRKKTKDDELFDHEVEDVNAKREAENKKQENEEDKTDQNPSKCAASLIIYHSSLGSTDSR